MKPSTVNLSRAEIGHIVDSSIQRLLERDKPLLANDVSERAITHKLAEYLQCLLPNLNVDCEYNRDATKGPFVPKRVRPLQDKMKANIEAQLSGGDVADVLAVSAYPDIIVHRRLTNAENLLVVEVKKRNSQVSREHDFAKLRAFTRQGGPDPYHFQFGVFILFETGHKRPRKPTLTWFVDGQEGSD